MIKFLSMAQAYHAYQVLGGFFGARVKAIQQYKVMDGVERVFDIGCGPGHIVQHLPVSIEYIGFDTDKKYIEFARRRFAGRGKFVCEIFDRTKIDKYGRPDLIMMNGLLHHIDDQTAGQVLLDSYESLKQHGKLLTLDGCYIEGQHPVSRYLMDHDRGEHVRSPEEYRSLVNGVFGNSEMHIREDLSWVPYSFTIIAAQKN